MQVKTQVVVVGAIEFENAEELSSLSSNIIHAFEGFKDMPKVVRDFLTATDNLNEEMRGKYREIFG